MAWGIRPVERTAPPVQPEAFVMAGDEDWIPDGFEYSPKLSDGFIRPTTEPIYCVRLLFEDEEDETECDTSVEEADTEECGFFIAEMMESGVEETLDEEPDAMEPETVARPQRIYPTPKHFPFLRLPSELRAEIFSYLLPTDRLMRIHPSSMEAKNKSGNEWVLQMLQDEPLYERIWWNPYDIFANDNFVTIDSALLHTNKQLQQEFLGMLLRYNTVTLSNRFCLYDWLEGPGKDLAIPHLKLSSMKWDLGHLRMSEEFSLSPLLQKAGVRKLDIQGSFSNRAERYLERHWRQKRTRDLFVKNSEIHELTKIRGLERVTVALSNWDEVAEALEQEKTEHVKGWTTNMLQELVKVMGNAE